MDCLQRGFRRAFLFSVCLGATSSWAAPLSGSFSSPMGPLQLSESADGTVVGKITDPKNPCGLPKGTVVLNGARLDDSVAGTLKTCKVITDTCAGFVDGDAILLITRGGGLLSGTAHFDVGACKTPMGGDAVTLKKVGGPPPPPKPKVNNRARAESLVVEAAPFIKSGEAEEARKRCEESAKLDPAYSQAFYCLGVTYYLRERYEEALEQYKLALEADPANHDVYYNIGCVFAVQGKTADALEYLKLALMNAYVDTQTLSTDADLKSLQGNPVFEKLKQGQFD